MKRLDVDKSRALLFWLRYCTLYDTLGMRLKDILWEKKSSICIRFIFHSWRKPRDLASCAMFDAVYISDCGINGVVHKLFVDNVHTKKWKMKSAPEGLSVLENGDLLVVFPKEKVIRRFKSEGQEISAIRIGDNIVNPHHACLNTTNEIVLCYGRRGDREHGVCVVNGRKTFDGTGLNLPDMWPMRVAVTEDGHVLVLSYSSQKILLLNSDLGIRSNIAGRRIWRIWWNRWCCSASSNVPRWGKQTIVRLGEHRWSQNIVLQTRLTRNYNDNLNELILYNGMFTKYYCQFNTNILYLFITCKLNVNYYWTLDEWIITVCAS